MLAFMSGATATACEPVLPLAMLFAGPGFTFASELSGMGMAFGFLAGAVAIKCVAFVFLERQLKWPESVGYMILANVLSSLIGLLMAVVAATPPIMFVGLPLVYGLSLTPARRLLVYKFWARPSPRITPGFVALAFPLGLFLSWVLFSVAADTMYHRRYLSYWLLKFLYVALGLSMSILLTSAWEESVIARLAARKHGEGSYFDTVVRANYVTFGVILLVAAIRMLPRRLHSPGFLAWLGFHGF